MVTLKLLLCLAVFAVINAKIKSKYRVLVRTGTGDWAGTDAKIFIKLYGADGDSEYNELSNESFKFERGSNNYEEVDAGQDIGTIRAIKIMHDNTGRSPGWLLNKVEVHQLGGLTTSHFIIGRWLQNKYPDTTAVYVDREEKDQCGISAGSRVVNGDEAQPNQWPWMAQIQRLSSRSPHHCGGTLIHPQWVLTAAHCVHKYPKSTGYSLTLGEHTLNKHDYTEKRFKLNKIIIHPDYSPKWYEYDIALLKLDKPAPLNANVKIACIPHQNGGVSNGKQCFVTGWGRENIKGPSSSVLRQAMLPKVSSETCEKAMQKVNKISITSRMMCAGGNKKSGCRGDSGGPLVCLNDDRRRYSVQGVVSWGSPTCDLDNTYSVFARVSMFSDWIKTNIYSEFVPATKS